MFQFSVRSASFNQLYWNFVDKILNSWDRIQDQYVINVCVCVILVFIIAMQLHDSSVLIHWKKKCRIFMAFLRVRYFKFTSHIIDNMHITKAIFNSIINFNQNYQLWNYLMHVIINVKIIKACSCSRSYVHVHITFHSNVDRIFNLSEHLTCIFS